MFLFKTFTFLNLQIIFLTNKAKSSSIYFRDLHIYIHTMSVLTSKLLFFSLQLAVFSF